MWWLGAIVVLVLGLMAYTAWSAKVTRSDLLEARASAVQLKRALVAQDSDEAGRNLRAMQQHFADAHHRTDGPVWAVGSRLPFVGDDITAVRTVAAVGDEVSAGGVAELVTEMRGGLADKLVPRGGGIDLDAVQSLAPLVSRVHRNLDAAVGRLRGVDSTGLTHWVAPSYDAVTDQVGDADSALAAADRAVQVLPTMLGQDGPKSYLVLFDNNAEIRATGGLPGAFAVLKADGGRISLTHQGAGADFGKFGTPVLPQSAAEQKIYDAQMAEFFVDTNFTPEFPRTAALVREMWRRTAHQKLDGVLSLDTVSLSYLLKATGPIAAPDNVTLTSQNAASELLNQVYFRLPDNEQQNQFFRVVARLVFEKVVSGVSSPTNLVSALGQGASEGRMYVHDFDPAVQRVLAGTTVAGDLSDGDPRTPQVGVYLNDATGSKMSFYLRSKVALKAESCAQGEQQLRGVADLSYTADSPTVNKLPPSVTGGGAFGTAAGQQLVLVRIYGPAGGELSDFRVAGQPTPITTVNDRGRPVATTVVQLRRGESVRTSWRVRSGKDQDRPARLSVTPGMEVTRAVTRVPELCGTSGE